jgi:glycine cleavage system H protein
LGAPFSLSTLNNLRIQNYKKETNVNIPADIKYTENDEWIKVEGNVGVIGITDYAQEQLSDIVYVEIILAEDEEAGVGDTCATVESVKAASDVYLPASGRVIAINDALADTPELVNSDPYGSAWMLKIELSNPDEIADLLDAKAYQEKVEAAE